MIKTNSFAISFTQTLCTFSKLSGLGMTSNHSRFSIRTKKIIHLPNVEEKRAIEFPSDFFNASPGRKPVLYHPKVTNLESIRNVVIKATEGQVVSVEYIVAYLYAVVSKIKATLTEDWVSYAVTIGKKDDTINPFALVETVEGEACSQDAAIGSATDKDDRWLVLWCLLVYRFEKISDSNYLRNMNAAAATQLVAAGCPMERGNLSHLKYQYRWAQSPDYRKIVACIDLFFFRFDTHPESIWRFGTTGSRFRDCAALGSLKHAADILELTDCVDLLDWVSNDVVSTELYRMLINEEESGKSYSYFPYQSDLGIVAKSAYSSRANPAFHTFCHTIGVMMGNTRSQNAKYILEKDVRGVITSAQWVAYAFHKTTTRLNVSSEDALSLTEPVTLNPDEWFNYMEVNNWRLTPEMLAVVSRVQQDILNPRPGTMAELASKLVFLGQ